MEEVEAVVMEPVWNKSWGNSTREILDGFAFNSFSDATVCCSGKRIPVHQIVLAASSDYFREILNSSMSSHPFIIFENVNLKALEQLLMFIYRGQVFIRPQEARSLFRLAEEFKVKGLSGPIGSDLTRKRDFDPPGVDVFNLNVFRKCVNPSKVKDIDILRCKFNMLLQRTPRMTRITESQLTGDFKVSKVKDNKYKIVGCNRMRIYDKEDANANILQENSETAREREIFDQFSHISLVEDKSKTFTEEAVKDLVARLTSHLNLKDLNSSICDQNDKLQVMQEPEVKQESDEQPQSTLEQELKVDLPPFGIGGISSGLEFNLIQQSMDDISKYLVKTTNIPTSEMANAPTSSEMQYRCDFCRFTSSHQPTYDWHKRIHTLERGKEFLERFGKDKRTNRIDRIRNRISVLESKSRLISYSASTMHLMEQCKGGTSSVTCTASTSKVNDKSLKRFLGHGWETKNLDSSSLRSQLQDICDLKKKVNPPSCSTKGQTKDNVTCQRYYRRHRRYICLYCSHKTYHKRNLIEHQKVHLHDREKPVVRTKKNLCPDCPYQANSDLYFSIHKKTCLSTRLKKQSTLGTM